MRDPLTDEFAGFERKLRGMARQDDKARRLMATPGVVVLVALTFVSAVGAPERFGSSRAVGPHSVKGSDLKSWALAVARRAGPRKARVARGRNLAVVLHRMLRDETHFIPHKAAPVMAY